MLNTIALMGRLTRDPELKKTPNDISTATFTIACERNFVKIGTERQVDFFEIVTWRAAAEFACKYFAKGQLVAVNGSLQSRIYEDKQGVKRKVFEVVAENLHFAGNKNTGDTVQKLKSSLDVPYEEMGTDPKDFALIDDNLDLPF